MNFLKRATPWMVTLVILLGVYVASYVWYYKPNKKFSWLHYNPTISKDNMLDHFYYPMSQLDKERLKQTKRKELLRQSQGNWEGVVRQRSQKLGYYHAPIRVCATIRGDQFTITSTESNPELVGVSWKIGCIYDAYSQFGISSNTDFLPQSSIFLTFYHPSSGQETLNQVKVFQRADGEIDAETGFGRQLVRPAARVSSPPNH
jgi:hypothetical protein